MELTHLDANGNAIMVDVGDKTETKREAIACGKIKMSAETFAAISGGTVQKGDVLGVARVAGIMAAKKTAELIPLCHPLGITRCTVDFVLLEPTCEVAASCTASLTGRTGVEMEALTGVTVALLTIYDMCKAIDKRMVLGEIHLAHKAGGKSGEFFFAQEENDHA